MKLKSKNKWLPCLILGALSMTALAFQSVPTSAEQADVDLVAEPVVEGQIPLVGYIENQEFSDIAEHIRTEFLSHKFIPEEGRDLATGIVTYIGPDIVSNGHFVPPEGFYIPPSQLQYMTDRNFPEEGCKIERLMYRAAGDYLVLLVDASDDPLPEYIEKCLLLATLSASG